MEHLSSFFKFILDTPRTRVNIDRCHDMFLFSALLCQKPLNVLELGIGSGYVTWSIVHALKYNGRGTLTSVDNWKDWQGVEPAHIAEIRAAGVNVVCAEERDFLVSAPAGHYDFIISDANHRAAHLWIDEYLRVAADGAFLFFHDTNRANLKAFVDRVRQLHLFHYHFCAESRADEDCGRGLLFAINRKEYLL